MLGYTFQFVLYILCLSCGWLCVQWYSQEPLALAFQSKEEQYEAKCYIWPLRVLKACCWKWRPMDWLPLSRQNWRQNVWSNLWCGPRLENIVWVSFSLARRNCEVDLLIHQLADAGFIKTAVKVSSVICCYMHYDAFRCQLRNTHVPCVCNSYRRWQLKSISAPWLQIKYTVQEHVCTHPCMHACTLRSALQLSMQHPFDAKLQLVVLAMKTWSTVYCKYFVLKLFCFGNFAVFMADNFAMCICIVKWILWLMLTMKVIKF